jgi:hypothetical protein
MSKYIQGLGIYYIYDDLLAGASMLALRSIIFII